MREKAIQSLLAGKKATDLLLASTNTLRLSDSRVIASLHLIQEGLDAGASWISGELLDEQAARDTEGYS
jgi:hypothetical protein